MSVANDILTAIQAAISTAYPDVKVYVRKGKPGPDPKQAVAGWTPGMALPAFVVSMETPEPVDEIGCFEEVSVGYPVDISYAKTTAASPGNWDEDPDVRGKRDGVRQLLYKPAITGIPTVADVRTTAGSVYGDLGGGTSFFSLWSLLFTCTEDRIDS